MTQPQPIGTCALLLNPEGKVLMGKRKNAYKSGYYGLPGGRVELNEPIAEAVQREVAEETGLNLSNLKYHGVVRENQGEYDFIHFVFVARNVTGVPTLCEPEKCEGWEWVSVGEREDEILPGHLAAMRMVARQESLVDIVL